MPKSSGHSGSGGHESRPPRRSDREIVWNCEGDLNRLEPDAARQDDAVIALEDHLKYPDKGFQVDLSDLDGFVLRDELSEQADRNYRYVATDDTGGATPCTLIYTFDENYIHVWGVTPVDDRLIEEFTPEILMADKDPEGD